MLGVDFMFNLKLLMWSLSQ